MSRRGPHDSCGTAGTASRRQPGRSHVSLDDAATKDVGALALRHLANSLAAAHPYQALRLLDLAETREREDYVRNGPRKSYDWYYITDVLIAIAAAWVRSDPARGELMAQRALLTAHSIDSPEHKSEVEWSPPARGARRPEP
jgi:hypothetical protein